MYGEPNTEGETEIDYGTYKKFQNKGFMTEILKRIIEWVKTQIKVKSIIASTDKRNMHRLGPMKKIISLRLEKQKLYFIGNWK